MEGNLGLMSCICNYSFTNPYTSTSLLISNSLILVDVYFE
jgi:hypothetical protein